MYQLSDDSRPNGQFSQNPSRIAPLQPENGVVSPIQDQVFISPYDQLRTPAPAMASTPYHFVPQGRIAAAWRPLWVGAFWLFVAVTPFSLLARILLFQKLPLNPLSSMAPVKPIGLVVAVLVYLAGVICVLLPAWICAKTAPQAVGRWIFGCQQATTSEEKYLLPSWHRVAARTGVAPDSYHLMIHETDALDAPVIGGNIICVTTAAMNRLSAPQLEAVIADQLARQYGVRGTWQNVFLWVSLVPRKMWRLARSLFHHPAVESPAGDFIDIPFIGKIILLIFIIPWFICVVLSIIFAIPILFFLVCSSVTERVLSLMGYLIWRFVRRKDRYGDDLMILWGYAPVRIEAIEAFSPIESDLDVSDEKRRLRAQAESLRKRLAWRGGPGSAHAYLS
ncbi:hypothetical protein KEM60_00452 [Austwickia sp. TVS 96-490-7B]|nr:hypothetical protein [Austwickia sp. TVS 96-490-7B]